MKDSFIVIGTFITTWLIGTATIKNRDGDGWAAGLILAIGVTCIVLGVII